MQLIYLHQYFKFPNEPGGTRSYDLAKSFANNGYKVEVVTTTSDEQFNNKKRWTLVRKENLTIHYIYLPYDNNQSFLKRTTVFVRFIFFAIFKLLSLKADVILATSTPLTIGIPALIKKWIHKTPYIFEVRDVWPEAVIAVGAIKNKLLQKTLFWLENLIYKNSAAIVPLSSDMKKSIVSRYPELADKPISIIENLSEINRFQNGFDSKTSIVKEKIGFIPRFTVLYAGTFGQVNGIDFVIKLAEKIKMIDSSIVFILIGNGAKKDETLAEANMRGVLNSNVFIWDAVSKNELPQLYHEASMGSSFVINIKELWANSANKFFDTLAAKRPILINHGGWQKEVILKENIGYILPQNIEEMDVLNFARYTQDNSLISTQRNNAVKVANNNYSLEIAVKKYQNLLEDINTKIDNKANHKK